MKKTWQWVIEYHRPPRNDNDPIEDWLLARFAKMTVMEREADPEWEFYRASIEWVTFMQSEYDNMSRQWATLNSKKMQPRHFNEVSKKFAEFMKSDYYDGLAIRRSPNLHYRMRNVVTGEIIPGELFCE